MLEHLKTLCFVLLMALAGQQSRPAFAAGTTPLSLVQQFGTSGSPLSGCLLYFFVAGTVSTQQNAFQDFGLTTPLPNPVQCDQSGRVPQHWLADGLIHIRLTDAAGLVQVDTTMQVLGPSSGGGGGGTVDPTTIASTGDIKFRPTSELLNGWVRLNGQTIGSAISGASGRANADTQNLFVYLWTNCPDANCPVLGGRGVSGLADFNANKQLTLLDLRGRSVFGLDDMGNTTAGRLTGGLFASGNSTTPQSVGGESGHTLLVTEMPSHNHGVTDPGHTHTTGASVLGGGGPGGAIQNSGSSNSTGSSVTGISIQNTGGGGSHNVMTPFMLGTWHLKL